MKTIKVLYNENKLLSETTRDAWYCGQQGEFTIRMVFCGSEEYTIGKKKINLYPGNFLVINEGTNYNRKIYTDFPAKTFAIAFAPQFLADFHQCHLETEAFLLDDPFNERSGSLPFFLETIFSLKGDMMFNALHLVNHFQKNGTDDLLIECYLYQCLLLFYRVYNQEILTKSQKLDNLKRATSVEIFKRINIAKDYMQSNFNQALTIEQISRYACLSPTHFYRTFKQIHCCSPHQYLIAVRLDTARRYLRETDYTINEVVNLIGFENSSSFIRLFRNRFGLTPGHYKLN